MRFLINALVFSTSIASLASACIYKRAMDVESFTYEGENGPLVWHHVNRTAYGACAHGQEQSPINIETHLKFKRADAILAYPSIGDFTAENNGHTIQFTPKNATKYKAKLGGGDYQLLQFHFHTPSEHRLNREHYPLEVHFVHQNPSTGALAAVGVFFDIGHVENGMFLSGIYPYLYDLEEEGAETAVPRVYLTAIHDVVVRAKPFNYNGSLTTPPCTEKINWFVVEEPLHVTVDQYLKMKQIMKFNSRYTQNEPRYHENLIVETCRP